MSKRRKVSRPNKSVPLRKPVRWWIGIFLASAAVATLVWAMRPAPKATQVSAGMTAASHATNTAAVTGQPDAERLPGRWLRTDGNYLIEIGVAHADGRLDAAYFNPRPINVAHAEWHRESDRLRVFIELRDVNYAGATYKLHYLPEKDRLVGEYFQPAFGRAFDVEFVRLPQ